LKIGDLGELGLLDALRQYTRFAEGSILGFDEDASDFPLGDYESLVVNVDTFVSSTDLLPGMTWAQAGRKSALMAVSDVVAKGVRPAATLVSLCAPEDFEDEDATEIVRGFSQFCLKSGVYFIGGDLGMSSDVVISAIALGMADSSSLVKRGGAKPGDIIAVNGRFGLTSVAFQILLQDKESTDVLRKRALAEAYRPHLDFELIPALAEASLITSCMDSSDGLGKTLNTMAEHSRQAFRIDRLPSASGVELFARTNLLDEMQLIMRGGEEFICAFTIPHEKWNDAQAIAEKTGSTLIEIGEVEGGEGVKYESSEGYVDVPAVGYDNFKEWT
jgi:thiamine-monophosphate kinase